MINGQQYQKYYNFALKERKKKSYVMEDLKLKNMHRNRDVLSKQLNSH